MGAQRSRPWTLPDVYGGAAMVRWPDAHSMSSADRRREVVAILARGLLRLKTGESVRPLAGAKKLSESSQAALDVSAKTRTDGSVG